MMINGGSPIGGSMDEPTVEGQTDELRAWRVRVLPGKAPEVMDRLISSGMSVETELLVVRADLVFGLVHLRSALYHAKRAIAESRNSSDSLAMETLLYLSAERQLGRAIRKMEINASTGLMVVAQLGGASLEHPGDWDELPESEAPDVDRLLKFGITEEEMRTVGRDSANELVLERIGSVDITKK
jgi:tRNA threonylcarbamoyladenosine modification (KEOPS) complex Cgi121 subunit